MNIFKNRTVQLVASGYFLWSLFWLCVGMVPTYRTFEYSNTILSITGSPITLTAYFVEPLLKSNLLFLIYLSFVGTLQWVLLANYIKISHVKKVLFSKNYLVIILLVLPLLVLFSFLFTFLISVIVDQLSPISATNFVGAIVIVIYNYFYSMVNKERNIITPLSLIFILTVVIYAFMYFIVPISHSRENLFIFFDTMTEEIVVSALCVGYVILFSVLFKYRY